MLRKKNKIRVILNTGHFHNIDSAVIISSVSKVVKNFYHKLYYVLYCLAYTADDDN